MSFFSYFRAAAVAAALSIAAVPALAQSLTTTYAGGNGQDGVLFDLTPTVDMTIQSFDAHMGQAVGTPVPVEVYWRAGTVQGNDSSETGWTLLGATTVASQGAGMPTPIPVGGLSMTAGQTYGIYMRASNGTGNYESFYYSNSSDPPAAVSNSQLSLTSFYGKANGSSLLAGSSFYPRQWNGTVYYTAGPTTTCASEGYTGTKLTWCKNICEKGLTGAALDIWIHRWVSRYRDLPYCAVEGGGEEEPVPTLQ